METQTDRWPDGACAAVSFSFDDARLSQVEVGLPLLDGLGVRATFYLSPDNLAKQVVRWRRAAEVGHELGNHTVHHPCSRNFAFARDHALEEYDLRMMGAECDEANDRIREMTGAAPATFAYPCGQTYVGSGVSTLSYVPVVAERFLAARCFAEGAVNDPEFCNQHLLAAFPSDEAPVSVLSEIVEATVAVGGWAIFAGHEIGDASARQTTGAAALGQLIERIRARPEPVWIDTVANVAAYVAARRSDNPMAAGATGEGEGSIGGRAVPPGDASSGAKITRVGDGTSTDRTDDRKE